MALPDTLSEFSPHPQPDMLLDISIHHACLSLERKEAFQQAFVSDPEMHALTDMIITGWLNDIKVVPHLLCPYWQHWETLTVEDGLVLHGEALIIPPSERERILQQLHQLNKGTTKAQLFVHGCVFWLGISKAIEEAVQQCEAAPGSRPKMLQHLSLQHQLCPAHGRCAPWTSLPLKELTT